MYMSPRSFTRRRKRDGGYDSSILHFIILAEAVDDDSWRWVIWDGRVFEVAEFGNRRGNGFWQWEDRAGNVLLFCGSN